MRKHFLFAVIWSAIAGSLTVTRKNKRFFSVNFIALIVAAVLSSPASAIVVTTLTSTRIVFTGQYRTVSVAQCGYALSYEQLAIIDGGKPEWVLTSQVYSPGAADLSLISSCDGYNIYDAYSFCDCLTEPLENVFPQKDKEKILIGTIEQGHVSFVSQTNSAGLLWIRKRTDK